MKRRNPLLILLITLLCSLPAWSQDRPAAAVPVPAWVLPMKPSSNSSEAGLQAEEGALDLLYDRQINLGEKAQYFHRSIKILSPGGLNNRSRISVSYDPSFQKLVFHSIQVIREGKRINKLDVKQFKIVQQETNLERSLYNGSITAFYLAPDIRVGDIIDFSYSLQGMNPVFEGRYDDILPLQFAFPLAQLHYRIVRPVHRPLWLKYAKEPVDCQRSKMAGDSVLDWNLESLAAGDRQDASDMASIMVSEYNNWESVGNWAVKLFATGHALPAALQQRIDIIRLQNTSEEARLLAVLRFVQDDIRYMAVEMGEYSHKPHTPSSVLTRRFGDCKDKALLFITMANALGIEAQPVLVNSNYRQAIMDWQPAACAFDHVVVQVKTGNQTYLLDPTLTYQRGQLKDIYFPDFGAGLLLSESGSKMIRLQPRQSGLVDIQRTFQMPDSSGTAMLQVSSIYSGSYADQMRRELNNNSISALQKQFQDFYLRYYPHIRMDSLLWQETGSNGTIQTSEYYTIPQLWMEEDGSRKIQFIPCVIETLLKKPKASNGKLPFYLPYPAHYREELLAHLPKNWEAGSSTSEISCSAFRLNSSSSFEQGMLTLQYEYESLKDRISPEETDAYLRSYNEANSEIHYAINYILPSPSDSTGQQKHVARKVSRTSMRRLYWLLPVGSMLLAGFLFWMGYRKRRAGRTVA